MCVCVCLMNRAHSEASSTCAPRRWPPLGSLLDGWPGGWHSFATMARGDGSDMAIVRPRRRRRCCPHLYMPPPRPSAQV